MSKLKIQKNEKSNKKFKWSSVWSELKQMYSKFYSLVELRKNSNLYAELLIFFLVVIFGYAFLDILFKSVQEIIKQNFGNDFFLFSFLMIFYVILLCILVIYILFMLGDKRRIGGSYLIIFAIVLSFVYLVPKSLDLMAIIKILIFLFILFFLIPLAYYDWKRPNWKAVVTILLSIVVFTIGIQLIQNTYGFKSQNIFSLFGCNENSSELNMTCTTHLGQVFAEHTLYCSFSQEIMNMTGIIEIIKINGMNYSVDFSAKNFYARENIELMTFNLEGNQNNKSLCLKSTFAPQFISEQEYKENKKQFVTYFLGLLFLCFITIPGFINSTFKMKN